MDWKKIKDISVKIGIFAINIVLVTGGVYYFKNKDQQEKEAQLREAEAYNEEIAQKEASQLQEAAALEKAAKEKAAKEKALADKQRELDAQKESSANEETPVAIEVPVLTPVAPVLTPVVIAIKINGECGKADSSAKRSNSKCDGKAPKSGLCDAGIASAIKFKPNKHDVGWNWTCAGENGGSSASCRCS